jgi:hypothetical protein
MALRHPSQVASSEAAVPYVSMTRAHDLLYLSYSEIDGHGKHLSRSSSFIDLIAKWCDFAGFRRNARRFRIESIAFFLCASFLRRTGPS